jgi:hypothetical protein
MAICPDSWLRLSPRTEIPAAVVAVSKEVVTGDPDQYISTSYVERQIRVGVPHHEDPWGWICGFYPGSEPGEYY